MKIAFVGIDKRDKNIFFDMLRTNLEHGYGLGDYQQTIGVDISVKHLFDNYQQIAKLIIWDICPEPFFKWVRPLFYNGAIGAVVLHSDSSDEGVIKTTSIIAEFKNQDFPKHLIIMNPHDDDPQNEKKLIDLEKIAKIQGFTVHFMDVDDTYYDSSLDFVEIDGNWKKLRRFYEEIIIDIFSNEVNHIPGNNYDIEGFKERYFDTLEKYEKSQKKMYELLENTGLEHDNRNIIVRLEQGLFTINIFSSACYYHFPNSEDTKYFCMVPFTKEFVGWSNISYLPQNFMLSVAKAFYLMDGDYDDVVIKQLNDLSHK